MDNILPTNEYTEVEGRAYSNPQVVLDEANSFIDNLRATQGQQNQEITQQTQNLGTNVPTNLGGLTGAEGYFTSRYQTPQTNSNVANLRAAAQAAALNDVLANEQAIWKKRYQDAYRAYQKSAYNKANKSSGGGGGGNSGGNNENTSNWDIKLKPTDTDNSGGGNEGDGSKKTVAPPDPDEYYVDGAEQTERIQERSGLPDWMVNVLKIFS